MPDLLPRINRKTDFVVLDNLFEDPDAVRALALQQAFFENPAAHKGHRTRGRFLFPGLLELFESLLGVPLNRDTWDSGFNGIFQVCDERDPVVYHSDIQQWAGAIYLSPDAPFNSGTSMWAAACNDCRTVDEAVLRAKKLGLPADPMQIEHDMYMGRVLDRRSWKLIDQVGNRYNRLVLWNARLVHSASSYFGFGKDGGRLTQLFFFDGA